MTRLPPLIVDHHAEFTAWRRGIHDHPELGFAESRTAALVAERLECFGIEVHRDVGRTGVVGVPRCGSSPRAIVSRNIAPVDTAVLSITQFHAGDAYNMIPQTARLSGTVRTFSNATMTMIGERMARTAQGVAQAMGAAATLDFRVNFAPTVNDAQQAEFAASVCAELVGADRVERDPALIGAGEDFSSMLERVPGCFFNTGNGEGEGGCEVHDPAYDFNDAASPLGVGFFVRAAERKLAPDAAAR